MSIKNIYALNSNSNIQTFHDPSVDYQYHPYTPYNRELVVPYDRLLTPYILQLDREVFADVPDGLSESQKNIWVTDKIGDLFIRILDKIRIHGWCVVLHYNSDEHFLVLSECERTSWLYESNGTITQTAISGIKSKRVGAHLTWTSNDGITFTDNVFFEDPEVLFIYWEFDNYTPRPDLIPSIWTIASQSRIASNMLMLGLARPVFYVAKYGNSIPDDVKTAIESVINDGYSIGIGATAGVLEEFQVVPIEISNQILPSLDQIRKEFAGVTHLPLSFFNGERTSNGLSDAGEKVGEMQIRSAKNRIFSRVKPYIVDFMSIFYDESIDVNVLELDAGDVTEDEMERDTQENVPQKTEQSEPNNGEDSNGK